MLSLPENARILGINTLIVNPRGSGASFWKEHEVCALVGAQETAAPLALATVAALLPQSWNIRVLDCDVEELLDEDIHWADLVMSGGMISQQHDHIRLIDRVRAFGKRHVVGGPDPTSNPIVYDRASHLVLGEAEITLPEFLRDLELGKLQHLYLPLDRKADMSLSPVPRYNLLKLDRYLHAMVQTSRGCPFQCEFCDAIEIYGRIPRIKKPAQVLAEFQALYDLGYRGHIYIADVNFIGNRNSVKQLLGEMRMWLSERNHPFEFSAELTINLADDEELLVAMQKAGFFTVFVGIETPETDTLVQTKKQLNTRRSLSQCIRKINQHGMVVSAGFILGFDSEKGSVADSTIRCIEECAIPVALIGLLYALPKTQLSRRLISEGRLEADFEKLGVNTDHCLNGLNFNTRRPKNEILEDFWQVLGSTYSPQNYFSRVTRSVSALNREHSPRTTRGKMQWRDLRAAFKLIWAQGIRAEYRFFFWKALVLCTLRNARSIRYAAGLMAAYLSIGPYTRRILSQRTPVHALQN